jgi:cytochrome c oxidase subunit III
MSSHASAVGTTGSVWEGGQSPYATNSKKFGMWLFLISDSLTFSAMLFAYTYSRVTNPDWPKPFDFSPAIIFSTIMTFCLLSSSLTMVLAVHAMNHGDRKATVRWILATMVGGGAFVVLHMSEWLKLINVEHVTALNNPWGVPLFGGTFFALTGLHMTHVLCGLIYLAFIAVGVGRGKFKAEDVEVSGLYWHFVDLVWMFIFPLVYLMSAKVG